MTLIILGIYFIGLIGSTILLHYILKGIRVRYPFSSPRPFMRFIFVVLWFIIIPYLIIGTLIEFLWHKWKYRNS